MATTLVASGTLGNIPTATGQSNQNHLVYGVNSARWFLFFVDTTNTTKVDCYVSSSNDLSTATWAAIGTGALSPALNSSDTWVANEGRNLAVGYANISSTDVVYIVANTSVTAVNRPDKVQAIRLTVTSSTATWGSWINAALTEATTNALNDPDGAAVGINTLSRAWIIESRLTNDRDVAGNIATNTDSGTSWTSGWGTATIIDNSMATTVNSGALAQLASGLMLLVTDSGVVTATTTNHIFQKSASATAWPANTALSTIAAATGTAQNKNDWALCGVTTSDVHFVRRITSTTFGHYRYSGTSWGTIITPPALTAGGGTAHLAASGIGLASDGTNLWCFWIDTDANNSVRYANWTSAGGWDAAWSTLSTGDTTTKANICVEYGSTPQQVGVIWTENASTPFAIVGSYLSTASGAPNIPPGLGPSLQMQPAHTLTIGW